MQWMAKVVVKAVVKLKPLALDVSNAFFTMK